jgi:lipid-A-disaccharide synthase
MKLFFSVGEPSGDLHGANLIRQLRRMDPGCELVGYGGPRMAAAGCQLHADLTELAVMWFLRVLLNLPRFWQLVGQADRYFRHQRPDAVILIDYPGFNWWIARRAKAHGIPVFYYGAPQMWAWAGWRVGKMRRLVDHVLCKLPFEAEWYRERGCRATYVGHPYFDELDQQSLDADFVARQQHQAGPLVTILPGSRNQEVAANLADLLRTAARVRAEVPQARFAIAAFNAAQAARARRGTESYPFPVEVHVGRTPELIHCATVCLACSGSVSLELLFRGKPTVIHYRISRLAYFVQPFFRKVRYITLVNLLASENRYCTRAELDAPTREDVPFPEYLTCEDRSVEMARDLIRWLHDPEAWQATVSQLETLRDAFGVPGASWSAAAYVQRHLPPRRLQAQPHHRPDRAA